MKKFKTRPPLANEKEAVETLHIFLKNHPQSQSSDLYSQKLKEIYALGEKFKEVLQKAKVPEDLLEDMVKVLETELFVLLLNAKNFLDLTLETFPSMFDPLFLRKVSSFVENHKEFLLFKPETPQKREEGNYYV